MRSDPEHVYDLYVVGRAAPAEGWMVRAVCPSCESLDHSETVYGDVGAAVYEAMRRPCAWCGEPYLRVEAAWRVRLHRSSGEA